MQQWKLWKCSLQFGQKNWTPIQIGPDEWMRGSVGLEMQVIYLPFAASSMDH
mgnify:CR=1 FL=1